ncbi:FG-GAP-like repeat-containing protein [Streptomyces sp. NPDC056831]|uniref:FG-GAP-like repeat-containing protein n=1 Tax=Streptomyces sp. NPDC056831 TaxID=3345954 RepID=UPI0036A3E0C3
MPVKHSRSAWAAVLLTAAITTGTLTTAPAQAVDGAPVSEGTYTFAAKIDVGDGTRACTGALVGPQWIVTAASCFTDDPTQATQVPAGKPALKTLATIGRTDLSNTAGAVREIVELVPRTDRDVVMARLDLPVSNVAPAVVSSTAPALGETLHAVGYGRTMNEWVPNQLHSGAFTVDASDATTTAVTGTTGSICKGDTGGPALRVTGDQVELTAIHGTSWQGGCLGTEETRKGAVETRLDDIQPWIQQIRTRPWAQLMAAADFNSDGKADLLTVDAADDFLYVQPGDGTGKFGQRVKVSPGKWTGMRLLSVTDFTGDGKADILAANVNGNLYLYPGNGNNGVTGSSIPRGGWNTIGIMAAADFNGDQKGDVIGVSENGNLYFYAGKGTTFAAAVEASTGWPNMRAVVAGDFTGDGKADAYAIHNSGALYLYTGKGNGTFSGAVQSGSGWQSMRLVSGGDFNGDGKADIVAINDNGSIYAYPGKGTGAFGTPVVTPPPNN